MHNKSAGAERQLFCATQRALAASAQSNVSARSVAQVHAAIPARLAHALRRDGFGRLRLEPLQPVGPPASRMFLGSLEEGGQGASWLLAGPILIFARGGRIDDAGDVPAAGEDEPRRPAQMRQEAEHAFGRGDVILPPRLNVSRRL